jgi:hypothetical protein
VWNKIADAVLTPSKALEEVVPWVLLFMVRGLLAGVAAVGTDQCARHERTIVG